MFLVINGIVVVFPILVYTFFIVYEENMKLEKSNIMLKISLFVSMYLALYFKKKVGLNYQISCLILPIILSYLYNEGKVALILSTLLCLHSCFSLNYNIYTSIIFFLLLYLAYKKYSKSNMSSKFLINSSIVLMLIYFVANLIISYNDIVMLDEIISLIMYSLIIYAINYGINESKNIISLHMNLKEFEKETRNIEGKEINKDIAFRLYDTYGFPIELTEELAKENGLTVDTEGFKQKFAEHQEKSREGASQKFKGGLASTGEMETKYHTATHLLNAALKKVLGPHVHQKGSNITAERMRFDFSHNSKMTEEEKQKTEDLVNEYIKMAIPVEKLEMKKEDALKMGAEAMFIDKYGDIVSVYKIGDVSLELCGGPHVKNTSELGHFKIKKEEASSAGVRRIKAILE